MTEPTTATFRALDHLSGGVAAHPEEADELRLENTVLRDRVRECGREATPPAALTLEPRMECDGPDAAEPLDDDGAACYGCGRYFIHRADCPGDVKVPSSSAGRGVGSPGVSAGAEEPAPPGWRHAIPEKNPLPWSTSFHFRDGEEGFFPALVLDSWGVVIGRFDTIALAKAVVEAVNSGVGATPTPKPAEAAEMYPQYQKRTEK